MTMQDNRGLTLIEVLVAFVLLSVVILSVLGATRAGASSYRSVSTDVAVQYESQIVMNQVEEYLFDCNAGAYWNNSEKMLCVAIKDRAGDHTMHFFKWDSATSELNYAAKAVTNSDGTAVCTTGDLAWSLMGSKITDFLVEGSSPQTYQMQIKISLEVTSLNKSYSTESITAMRNPIEFRMLPTTYDSWLQLACT